jgi:hypothetical protein
MAYACISRSFDCRQRNGHKPDHYQVRTHNEMGSSMTNISQKSNSTGYMHSSVVGHLTFASDQLWFWRHMITQYDMGTVSTSLSAYTLATLHEVSIIAQASGSQCDSTAHAGDRLDGCREGSEAESLALPLELLLVLTLNLTECTMVRRVCLARVLLLSTYHRTSLSLCITLLPWTSVLV